MADSLTHWRRLPSSVPLGETDATQHVVDSCHPIRARRCGFSPALSAPPRKLSACCPRESLTERLRSLRPPPPTNSPQGKSWDSSCQPRVGKNTAEGREYSKDGRANASGGGRWGGPGLSHSGRRPPQKATRPIKASFKAVQSVLSLYETLIYCFFCLKRQKRKKEKNLPAGGEEAA